MTDLVQGNGVGDFAFDRPDFDQSFSAVGTTAARVTFNGNVLNLADSGDVLSQFGHFPFPLFDGPVLAGLKTIASESFSCADLFFTIGKGTMKLADYLKSTRIRRGEFAEMIGVSGGRITQLCDGTSWPSKDVAERISRATEGHVTANDFMHLDDEPQEQVEVPQ